jgi:hypothetical protein
MKLGFEIDRELVDEGDWVALDHLQPGFRVKLRSGRCAAYKRALNRRMTPIREDRTLKQRDRQRLNELAFKQALADAVIVTWEGLKDAETGEPVEFTRDLAHEFMTEEQYALFQEAVAQGFQSIGVPTIQLDDDDESEPEEKIVGPEALRKNSKRGSATA